MVIDQPIPSSCIPSSQPDKDKVVSIPHSPARTNAVGPSLFSNPTGKPIPAEIQSIFTNHTKWMEMDFDSLPVRELLNLPEIACATALSRGIKIPNIIHHKSQLLINDQAKSTNYV